MRAEPIATAVLPGRHQDPIVAIATAPGRGAVGIVRASGHDLAPLIKAICGRALLPRQATLLPFAGAEGQMLDRGLAIHFPAFEWWCRESETAVCSEFAKAPRPSSER